MKDNYSLLQSRNQELNSSSDINNLKSRVQIISRTALNKDLVLNKTFESQQRNDSNRSSSPHIIQVKQNNLDQH